jgi:regulator of protease activity HflC (stomatin/prohibitin superfamily)
MPGTFGFAIFIFIVAAIIVLVGVGGIFAGSKETTIGGIGIGVAVALLIGLPLTLVASYDRVDTRNVGILTDFGRPDGVQGAGVWWHAPWKQVHELPESIQLQAFESNSFDDASKGQGSNNNPAAIGVRLANNSMAYVNANLNWRIKEGAAQKLFQDYGGGNVFGTIKEQLVDRQEQVALSKVFAKFNPQIVATANAPAPGQPAPPPPGPITAPAQGASLPDLAREVKQDLQGAVGAEIEILDVRIQGIFYDQQTQQRIDMFNQKVQETMNAAQDVKTAEQQRDAAIQRAQQPKPDLTIAVFNCIQEAVAQHQPQNAAGCWGQIGGQPLIQLPKP